MNNTVRILAVAAAVASAGAMLRADEFELDDMSEGAESSAALSEVEAATDEGEGAESSADGEEGSESGGAAVKKSEKTFETLPLCSVVDGTVEVLRPGSENWEPAVEGRFYALGTSYRTVGPLARVTIKLGKQVSVSAAGDSGFRTCSQPLEVKSRTVALESGTVKLSVPINFPDGLMIVSAPGFSAVNPKGQSLFTYRHTGDGDNTHVRCITGDISVEGRHFKILAMKAATEIDIRMSQDLLFTGLYGKRGDANVVLDQGRVQIKDFTTGETSESDKKLEWKLSPLTAVRIHRALPSIGEKMAVSIMTFDANGALRNRCAFTENTVSVNSGEIGPAAKKDREELDKKAADATETVTVDVDVEPEAEDGEPSAAGESEAGSDNDSGDDDFDF